MRKNKLLKKKQKRALNKSYLETLIPYEICGKYPPISYGFLFFGFFKMGFIKKIYEYQSELILNTTGRSKVNFNIILDDESQCAIRVFGNNQIKVYWRNAIPPDVAYGCMVILSEFMQDNQLDMIGSYECKNLGPAKYTNNIIMKSMPRSVWYDFVFISLGSYPHKILVSVDERDEMIQSGLDFRGISTHFLSYKARSGQKTIIKSEQNHIYNLAFENKDDFKDCALYVDSAHIKIYITFNRYDESSYDNKDDNGLIIPALLNERDLDVEISYDSTGWEKGSNASIIKLEDLRKW